MRQVAMTPEERRAIVRWLQRRFSISSRWIKHKVRYLIVGGEAVIQYGYARLTGDTDIIRNKRAAARQKDLDDLAFLLEARKRERPRKRRASRRRRRRSPGPAD